MTDAGLYLAVFFLPRPRTITVGRLGRLAFEAGFYFYVGSAQRHRLARLARHARRRKPHRWHIDYLAAHAPMLGAFLLPGSPEDECRLARLLADHYAAPIPRFGSSDCRCATHLFHRPV